MADSHAELIRQAVLRAREGHAQEALDALLGNSVPETSANASLYHFTVGSLLLRQGKSGAAFAHLDAALHREPGSHPIQELWQKARDQTEKSLGAGALDQASLPLESWVESPMYLPAEALLAVLAAVAAFRCASKGLAPAFRRTSIRWAAALWVAAAVAACGHYWGARFPKSRAAAEIILRSGPSEDFLELGRVDAGSELRVLASQDGWFRVRVSPETSGWAPSSGVLLLKPPSTTREP